jgi:hypothetical protein
MSVIDLSLPPDLMHRVDAWIVFIIAVLAVLSPFIGKAQAAARDWLISAEATPSPHDDKLARVWLAIVNGAAWLVAIFPRFTNAWGEVKRTREELRKIPRPPMGGGSAGGTTLLVLLIVAPFLAASTGCGGTQMSRARTVLSVSGQAVIGVEHIFAPKYAEATAAATAESETFEEYAAAMRRWNAGATSLLLAATALHVAEGTLDAIDAGMDGDIAGVLACAGVALVDVVTALSGLVDIPDALRTAVTLIGALAGPMCTPTPPPDAAVLGVPHASDVLAVRP